MWIWSFQKSEESHLGLGLETNLEKKNLRYELGAISLKNIDV